MPNVLRNLTVTKVDFVDAGDNKGAHVILFKRAPEGVTDVKIDKSKLTAEEVKMLEEIEKKAGIQDEPSASGETASNPTPVPASGSEPAPVQKNASDVQTEPVHNAAPVPDIPDDVYKGIHPVVRAELDALKKWKDAAEDRELTDIAKKYEILGKKADELVPVLKSLKAAGGGAYEQMIAVMDASLQMVEKSGLFTEIGKSGAAANADGTDAWSRIQKHAQTLMDADSGLSFHAAVDKACQAHPELVHEYEESL